MSGNLTPSETFRRRMREVRERAGISQIALARRLAELGYDGLKRDQIVSIEAGRRRVTLDDAIAIAAALGVAPINLMVPFERAEPLSEDEMRALAYPEDWLDDPARAFFPPVASLEVAAELVLAPLEARAWIRGTDIYSGETDPDVERRFYIDEAPPPYRHRLQRMIRAHLEGRKFKWYPLDEEKPRRYAARGMPKGLPANVRAALLRREGDDDA